jgi:ADP-ribose pyrophosphatase
MQGLKLLQREKLHAGKVFDLIVDQVEYPSGNRAVREVADHPGGAVTVPFLNDSTLLLIRQFRYPLNDVIYEFPAGKLDPQETPERCAARELEEETGYRARSLTPLGKIYTSPGFCTELLHLFVATGLTHVVDGPRLEEGELGLTVLPTPLETVAEMIRDGTIVDAKTICAFFLAMKQMGES